MSDKSLLQDFITETGEHLEETERNLLHLEQQPDDADTLNKIFRSIHTIKGSSEYLGLARVADLSHKLESLLEQLRRGERGVDRTVVDLLMGCNDRIGVLVDELDKYQEERSAIDDLLSDLKATSDQASSEADDTSAEDDEVYDEDEYDEELFGIFVEQLKDGLAGLAQDAGQLSESNDPSAVLETSAERLVTLRSSSNYMGYDELRGIHEQWAQLVDDTKESLQAGDPVDLASFASETMIGNIERIKALFPKIEFDPVAQVESEPEEAEPDEEPQAEAAEQADSPEEEALGADQSLLADFITETGEHLEETERNLLRLEQQPDDADTLNKIFRSIHTIKGSSEYLGLTRVADLSHKLESLLELVRRGERGVDSGVIDLLMGCNDRIGALVDELDQHQEERSSIDDLVSDLKQASEQTSSEAGDAAAETDDSYDEDEYDEELFGIFVEQLKDGLSGLAQDARQLYESDDPSAVLETSADRLVTLRSSSNYMGYDELRQIYEQWTQLVDDALESLRAGDAVDPASFAGETMIDNIERVKALFPKVEFDPVAQVEGEADTAEPDEERQVESTEQAETPAEEAQEADQSLLQDFITETGEHLEETERNLLQLEQQPDNMETLNDIFRSVHTIKGSSEYLGMVRIAKLAHKLESLLDMLRRSERRVNSDVIDLLIGCNDRIGALVTELEENREEELAVDDLLTQLESLLTDSGETSKDPEIIEKLVIEDESGAIYGEEYDHELFSIFLEQHNNGLESLSEEAESLREGGQLPDVLERSKEQLKRLHSSANYMEYDELCDVHDQWLKKIDETLEQHAAGDSVDIEAFCSEVMTANIKKAKSFFSNMRSVTHEVEDSTPDVVEAPIEQDDLATAMGIERDVDFNSISLSDISKDDAPIELEPMPPLGDDDSLLDKLASAFDSRLGFSSDTVKQYFNEDIETNLFSEEDNGSLSQKDQVGDATDKSDADELIVDMDNVESMLFSGEAAQKPSDDPQLPEQVPAPPVRRPKRMPSAETEDSQKRYSVGRRQSDKFRDRMLKQSIRVDSAKIDALMNQVGELVVSRSGLNQLFGEMRELQSMLKQSRKLDGREMQIFKTITNRINEATTSLGRVTSELQENVMKVRMLPIAQLFSRYPRVVHDLVRNTDKKVNLEIYGEDTELDKKVIEQLADPLIHIIRNAVDHGIEGTALRRQKGKDETGTIRMEAYPESNYVVIEISDDGRGIDTAQIRERAIQKELITAEEALEFPDEELLSFIMRPGFSTAEEITHTSGRGVGMDVVKDNIEKINGTIDIFSSSTTGARFRIKIPLTLAIIPALLVRVADEIFTIPLSTVDETLRISKEEISSIEGLEMVYLRENTVPLIRLKDVFRMGGMETEREDQELFVVIVNTGSKQVGFVVDELKGRQEVVIKPLEDYLQEKSGFSGATILGDGNISLILDVFEMVQISLRQHASNTKAIVS